MATVSIGTNSGNIGATLALTVGAGGVPAGALISVIVYENATTIGGSVADTAGNTYTAMPGVFVNNQSFLGFGRMFYAWNTLALVNTNTITYTRTTSAVAACISAIYATGIQAGSAPLDAAVTATSFGNSAAPSVTSGTPAVAGELFIAFVGCSSGSISFVQDTGHGWASPPNAVSGGSGSLGAGNQVNAGTGTKIFSPTISFNQWCAFVYGFKPGGGANTLSISITSGQTVTMVPRLSKVFAITSPSTILLRRFITKSINITSAQAVLLGKGISRLTAMTQGQVVSLVKTVGKRPFVMTSGQNVVLVARLAYRVVAAMTNSQVFTLVRSVGKNLALLSPQSVLVRRAMSRSIAAVSDSVVSLKNSVGKPLAVVQGQAVALLRSGNKRIAILSGETVRAVKRVSHRITVLSGEFVRGIGRFTTPIILAMTNGQTALLSTMAIVFAAPKQMLKNAIHRIFILRSPRF